MRDNGNRESGNSGSGRGGHIKAVDHTRTEHQVPAFKGFKPEEIHRRGNGHLSSEAPPTQLLAQPPAWMQRDDLPCTEVVQIFGGRDPFDTGDVRAARKLCAGCPVMHECLEDAMAHEDGLGPRSRYLIRGGLTAQERGDLARTNVTVPLTSTD